MKIKNKILLFVTVVTLIIVLLMASGVRAYSSDISSLKSGSGKSKIGEILSLGFGDTLAKENTYCIQKNKTLEIDGNQATLYKSKNSSGETVISDTGLNAQVAYILSKNQGYGKVSNTTEAQDALWHIANDWIKGLFGDLSYGYIDNAKVAGNNLNKEAKEYAIGFKGTNSLNSEEQTENSNIPVVDKTNKDKLTVSLEDGFSRVGPFRWQFGGKLESITVKGDNRELSSSDVKFVKYNGTTAKTVKVSEISSGEAFYVDISNTAGVSKLTGLSLKTSLGKSDNNEIYKARIWFLTSGTYQNVIYVDTDKTTSTPSEGSSNYDIKTSIDLQLKKVDDRDTTKPLVGVGFTLSTTIQTYDLVGTQDHYKNVSCSHVISSGYTDENGVSHPAQYAHSYDTVFDWTQNKYAWVDHTMYLSSDGTWSENSSVVYTDNDGLISMKNIKFPTNTITNENYKGESYTSSGKIKNGANVIATEVSNPYYGYTIGEKYTISLNSGKQIANKVLTNHQKLVKLSGYVWLNEHNGKDTVINNVYDAGEEGKNDIRVYLKDKSGNVIKTTTTSELGLYSEINGGEYQFVDIDLDALERGEYHVEFEYCGIDYQSVMPTLGINNGSKAVDTTTRNILDSKFASVNSTGSQSLHMQDVTVNYNNISTEHQSTVNNHTGCNVYARTYEAGYNLYSGFVPTSEEIRYVNLGLLKKVETDYALAQDLHNVNVSVNGKSHIYRYGTTRFTNEGNDIDENSAWNVGVKFQNNKGTYNRAIYHADAWYEDQNKSNEIKVYVTYKVALKNESSYLGRINSIVDYCDNRYTLIKTGTSIDDNYNIGGTNINAGNKETYNDEYTRYVLDVNSVVKPGETNYIYLQFELNREGVLSIMNGKDLFNNVAEITSYTTFKDNNVNTPVSVVDKDSVPGNMIPGNVDTYEDDTDAARSLKLELKNARALEGTVFVDNPLNINKDEVNTGAERKGNGIFDNGETTLSEIEVTLKDMNGNIAQIYDEKSSEWKDAKVSTDNGNFSIVGYIPGNYVLTYTWGNKEYKVQYYKGTIYDENRNQQNKFWYKDAVDTRKTDALDSKDIRIAIDNEMKAIDINTLEDEIAKAYDGQSDKITKTSMDSTTPEMEFSVEYDTTITDGNDDKVQFIVRNVDFGIIERAKQQLEADKRVTAFKITLANGQVLVDATVTPDGKLKGVHDYTTYFAPSVTNGISNSGMIRVELDNELIEGATLEATYEMTVKNIGEVDYVSDRYYYYGNSQGSDMVKVSVDEFIDYLDRRLAMADSEETWKEQDADYLADVNAKQKDNESYINNTRTYLTDKLKGHLSPNESKSVEMKVSKLLTSTDDNTFTNEAEITRVTKNDGNPGNGNTTISSGSPVRVSWTTVEGADGVQSYFAADFAENIVIIPSTGEDKSYAMPIIIGITTMAILGAGIFVIKKFVIDNK